MTLAHPITGEVIHPFANTSVFRAAIEDADAYIGALYRRIAPVREARDLLQARLAEQPGATLPPARYRTATQERVAYCPRCRTSYEEAK